MLNFEFEHEITKEFLLKHYSEETYFEHYLGIPITKRLFCSPLRKDNRPTCSFYRNKNGDLIYKDFGDNSHYTFINVVMSVYNLTYYQALKKIAEDFNLVNHHDIQTNKNPIKVSNVKFESKEDTIIQIEKKDFTNEELSWWKTFGIDKNLLKKYNVYSCNSVFLNGRLIVKSTKNNPVYGYYFGKKNGKELWKIYMPLRKERRFLNNLDSKILQGFKQLPEKGPLLIITKSLKDCVVFNRLGIPAVAPNSETIIPSQKMMDHLHSRFKYIVFYWDRDYAGISNLQKIRKIYPECAYFVNPAGTAKDLSDCVAKYGLRFVRNQIPRYLEKMKNFFEIHETKSECSDL